MNSTTLFATTLAIIGSCTATCVAAKEAPPYLSHPPIRPLAKASERPKAEGPARFVDAARGSDASDGSEKNPWKTINHALKQLAPGETLYLRGGSYFENVYCAVTGTREKPITIRSHPGEVAVIDGGIPEFQRDPASAWEPVSGSAVGEYRSTKTYKNIRDVVGLFGDSNVGLQTYWHTEDLRADNELWITDPEKKKPVQPVWCGPGLWYDAASGRIHARLAHTHLQTPGLANYAGETDARKLPLVVAPFNSVALFVDGARHVRFQDMVFRGGGQNTVVLQLAINVEFDNVTVFAGTYGIRARGTGPLRMTDCAVRGMIPPWAWRDENSLYTYTPTAHDPFVPSPETANARNISRLPTHAVLVTEGSYEFEVFHYPYNHDWEIAHSEFSEGHDGVYLSGRNIRFHHNWVDNFQDDAIYLSAPSPYFNDGIFIHQNLISHSLMAFGCNSRGGPAGSIYIARNIADLRRGANCDRPSLKNPAGTLSKYHIFLMHGRERLGVESLFFYQNTFVCPVTSNDAYAHRTLNNTDDRTVRRVFNNLCVYLNRYPAPPDRTPLNDIQMDGNLHWSPAAGAEPPKGLLEKTRACAASEHNKTKYAPGWEASGVVGDPKFAAFSAASDAVNDYRLQPGSPAVGAGIVLPAELEDPLRLANGARPDIGALPRDGEPLRVGIRGRVVAGGREQSKE